MHPAMTPQDLQKAELAKLAARWKSRLPTRTARLL